MRINFPIREVVPKPEKARPRVTRQLAREQRAQEHSRLESDFGSLLDKMPRKKVCQMISEKWPEDTGFYLGQLPGRLPVKPGMLRESLLSALDFAAKQPTLVSGVQSC